MSEPAWKKAGLALKRQAEDPVATPGEKKKPKRDKKDKKPRAVRKMESIESHWEYCSTFVNSKDQWKFSKQQQNWLLKHINLIPEEKEDVVFKYLETVQGGSKDRLVNDAKDTIDQWNEQSREAFKEQEEREAREEKEGETQENGSKRSADRETKKETKQPLKVIIDADHAMRARNLYKVLTGTRIALVGLDETRIIEEDVDVEKFVE